MKIALVTYSDMVQSLSDVAAFLAASHLTAPLFTQWRLEALPEYAGQILDVLERQWQETPVDLLVFPADMLGDELATRLAWRIGASSVCQATCWDDLARCAGKSCWGNALNVSLLCLDGPVCLSVARGASRVDTPALPPLSEGCTLAPVPLTPALCLLSQSGHDDDTSLSRARRVLIFGQGGANSDEEQRLAYALEAEIGYTRQRMMLGGCDESKMIGVSGVFIAPELCLVVGASGAPAFSAGIQQSQFIVVINASPDAPVFSQADVGIVAEWQPALQALAAHYAGSAN